MTLFHKALHPIKEHFSVHQKKRANFKGKLSVWSWKKYLLSKHVSADHQA